MSEVPLPFLLFAGGAFLASTAMAVGLGAWGRRKLGQPWKLWWIGGATFVASQVVHLPMLAAAGPLMQANEASGALPRLAVNVAILGLSAGLCEELARYGALRWLLTRVRSWSPGVMYGAGHGGMEAILVMGAGLVQGGFLLAMSDQALAEVQKVAPAQAELLASQIRLLREAPAWASLGGVWERASALTLHVALALMVLRAVRTGRWGWLVTAIAVHSAVNAVALTMVRALGLNVLAIEGTLTVAAVACLVFIRRERRSEALPAPPVEPLPVQR